MNRIFNSLFLVFLMVAHAPSLCQQIDNSQIHPAILNKRWPAYWINCPGTPDREFGVYHFRKVFDLPIVPDEYIIHVSADNRYRLFVNERSVCVGPARGDLQHWYFESVNIGPYMRKGKNVIAVVVWNFGEEAPNSQMSLRTGLIVAGNTAKENEINTDDSWKVLKNESYTPITGFMELLSSYVVVGPGENIDMGKYPWGWETVSYDDQDWVSARIINEGQPRSFGTNGNWMLIPRNIPLLEERLQRLEKIRYLSNISVTDQFLQGRDSIVIDTGRQVHLILDQGVLTTGYPVLNFSGGGGAEIRISYAESLFYPDGSKGNRDEINGKEFRGYYDVVRPDGNPERTYQTLWFRTFRYIKLDITTGGDPLVIRDFYSYFTAYPFEQVASFHSDDPRLNRIWETGWRTARLCAGEIYYDCPYYEQMQYVGDTRIQALISLYVSGDDRLMKKAIELFHYSIISDGLTQSRYPSSSMQIIPPYSLFWISMIYDYWMYRGDDEFVTSLLPWIHSVLYWFEQRLDDRGLLGPLEWWNFVDWADEWPWEPVRGTGGVPNGAAEGGSSILTLHLSYTLKQVAEIEKYFGHTFHQEKYQLLSEDLATSTRKHCWDKKRGLLADTPVKDSFSQHANIFGILTNTFPDYSEKEVMGKILEDKNLIQSTLYFRFYLFRALRKCGMGNHYLQNLSPWYKMLDNGLTTFAEKPDPSRSDCHAWSASPLYDLIATVGGIEPAEPGFNSVTISPCPGHLQNLEIVMPHPRGKIQVHYTRSENNWSAIIWLPPGLTGTFNWNGISKPLASGRQVFNF